MRRMLCSMLLLCFLIVIFASFYILGYMSNNCSYNIAIIAGGLAYCDLYIIIPISVAFYGFMSYLIIGRIVISQLLLAISYCIVNITYKCLVQASSFDILNAFFESMRVLAILIFISSVASIITMCKEKSKRQKPSSDEGVL